MAAFRPILRPYHYKQSLTYKYYFLQPLKKMIDKIRKYQLLNNQIFATLNKYLHTADWTSRVKKEVQHFPIIGLETEVKLVEDNENEEKAEINDNMADLPSPPPELKELTEEEKKRISFA